MSVTPWNEIEVKVKQGISEITLGVGPAGETRDRKRERERTQQTQRREREREREKTGRRDLVINITRNCALSEMRVFVREYPGNFSPEPPTSLPAH